MITRFIDRFVQISIRFHRLIVLGALLLTGLGFYFASGMVVDSGMENLLPEKSPVLQASQEMEAEFGGQDNVILVVNGKSEQAEVFLVDLAQKIKEMNIAYSVFYRIDINHFAQYLHLYIDTGQYEILENELADSQSPLSAFLDYPNPATFHRLMQSRMSSFPEEQRAAIAEKYTDYINPQRENPGSPIGVDQGDATGLLAIMLFGYIDVNDSNYYNGASREFIVSDSGETYLMLIKPAISMENYVDDRAYFFTTLQDIIDHALQLPAYNSIQAGYTGGQMVIDYEGDNMAFASFTTTAIVTIILILILLTLSFRQILVPIAAAIPLVLGIVLAASFAVIIYDNISFFSLAFAVLLIGLGIDFAIHTIARYAESRSAGKNLEHALVETLNHTGRALTIGAVTTAIVFAAFLLADFKAFSQMGLICSAGIIFTLLAMLTVMPAILAWKERLTKSLTYRDSEYRLLAPLGRGLRKSSWVAPILVLIMILLSWHSVSDLKIATNLRTIFPGDLPSIYWLDLVQEDFDYNPDTISLLADNIDELNHKDEALNNISGVAFTESLLDFLPRDQELKVALLGEAIYRYQNGILKTGHNLLPISQEQLTYFVEKFSVDNLPEELLAFYRSPSGKFLIEITPTESVWEQEFLAALQIDLAEAGLGTPTGMPFIFREVIALVKNDIGRITIIAAILVALILFIFFRSVLDAALVMVTIASTILLTVAISLLTGLEFNVINLAGLPLIIGIGVDSCVHITYRLRSSGLASMPHTLVHTGKAVILTSLTTIIAFGSLAFTGHPGLAGFGKIVVVGMSSCLVLTLTLLPSSYVIAELIKIKLKKVITNRSVR